MSLPSSFLARLEATFPDYPLAVQRWHDPDDPSIEWFLNLLLVPRDDLHAVSIRAWDIAIEEYGDELIPFHLTTVSPESSAKHFAKELEEDRKKRFHAVVGEPRKIRAVLLAKCLKLSLSWSFEPGAEVRRAESPAIATDATVSMAANLAPSSDETAKLQQEQPSALGIVSPDYALAA